MSSWNFQFLKITNRINCCLFKKKEPFLKNLNIKLNINKLNTIMKYLYPLALILLLASCQKEDKKVIDRTKTDWVSYGLLGDVKTVSTKSWLVNEKLEKVKPQNENTGKRDNDISFSDDGMLANEKLFVNNAPFEENTFKGKENKQQSLQYIGNSVGIKTDYTWDKTGKKNTSITRRNPDNTQIDRIEMKYQGNKVAEKVTYNPQNNPIDKVTYIYDSKGNLNLENIYLGTEYVQYKALYTYDKKNRILSEARYDKDSKMQYQTRYTYDGDNLIKKETVNEKGEPEYVEKFTHDKNGNVLTHDIFEKFENSNIINTFKYDAANNKTEWNVSKNGTLMAKALFTFDKYKNQTSYTAIDEVSGKTIEKREYIFEYDPKGNWTKKTIRINDKPQFIEERTITYFDKE